SPRFVFNPEGDCLAAKLRPGNVHSADGWDEILLPIIDRYRARGQTVVVRADAAFALPALYEALEQRGCRTRSAVRPVPWSSGACGVSSPGPAADRAMRRWFAIGASSIRRPPGTGPGA